MRLITPVPRLVYDRMTRARAADGFGPFCGSYAGYLRVVEQHNHECRQVAA